METTLTYYHLGSWTTITDEKGSIEREQSFDAWGKMRDPYTWREFPSGGTRPQGPMFDRGFTGHEHLFEFGLINMNGRCYDPVMSSFLSVDRYVQNPSNSQSFNRYSYCLNNPLKYVDPSGWQMNKPYMASYPAWDFGNNMSYEPRDLQYNSPYMFNYSLSGGDGVSYGGGGGSFARTYGYSVVNSSYYINNNFYINRELALRGPTIRDVSNAWWKDPSRETRQALVDAGISELNVGVLEKDGLRHGGARIKVDGKEYILPLPTLEVGGDDFYIGVIAPDIDLAPNAGSGLLGLQNVGVISNGGTSIGDGTFFHTTVISSTSSIVVDGIKYAEDVKKVSQLSKTWKPTATVLRSVSWAAPAVNTVGNYLLYRQGEMTKGEFLIRTTVGAFEFGLSYVPFVGPLLSMGLTAYDVGGGLDNFYKRF